ncbi:MAG: hypothetical protein JXQ74_02640 [Alphaproteobacteria bacterium]|nr:hypothetical protein [Alphaproteobacteria bacterium]
MSKSYKELEKRFSQTHQFSKENLNDEEKKQILKMLGHPEAPSAYEDVLADKFQIDSEANEKLHAVGLTPEQVQVVYELANERLMPQLEEAEKNTESMQQNLLLKDYFGSETAVESVAKQVLAYAENNFSPDVAEELCQSAKGVIGIYEMMQSNKEPGILAGKGEDMENLSDQSLRKMMQDPKYWREQDPEFVKKVKIGFEKLYGEK